MKLTTGRKPTTDRHREEWPPLPPNLTDYRDGPRPNRWARLDGRSPEDVFRSWGADAIHLYRNEGVCAKKRYVIRIDGRWRYAHSDPMRSARENDGIAGGTCWCDESVRYQVDGDDESAAFIASTLYERHYLMVQRQALVESVEELDGKIRALTALIPAPG